MLCFCFGCGRRAEVASALDTCPLLLSPLALAGARRRNRFVPTVASVLASSQHKGGVQQLYSVITASNGARGGEDRQGCQDHDGHPEGHGHPGLGPRCHPPDARVLLQVGLIISKGVNKISLEQNNWRRCLLGFVKLPLNKFALLWGEAQLCLPYVS